MKLADPSILYICQNALGDIITSLPSIAFLRQAYPHAMLDVCINGVYADIFAADPNVDRVISAPAEWFETNPDAAQCINIHAVAGLRSAYGCVIDSMSSAQTGRLITLLRPSKSVGIGFDDVMHVYDLPLPKQQWRRWGDGNKTVVECFGDLPRMLTGDFKGGAPVLHVTNEALAWGRQWIASRNSSGGPVVAFNPGAGRFMKRWPLRHFMEAARILQDNGNLPLFVFGPKEAGLHAAHRDEILAIGGLVYYSEDFRIQPIAGILRSCALLVTNDCAVMHVGASVGCRVVSLFGPSISSIWFPYSKIDNRVLERDVPCRLGCRDGCAEHACMATIFPEEVVTHAMERLRTGPTLNAQHREADYKILRSA